jgi:hypothetical protein
LKSSNKECQQRRFDYLGRGKDKNGTVKMKCLEQTTGNFAAFSDRKLSMKKCTNQRRNTGLLERNNWKKIPTH